MIFWSLLELIGQAATLQLIDAGNRIHYQHYDLQKASPLFLAVFLLQSAFVCVRLIKLRREIFLWLKEHFGWWQLLLIALLFTFSSAALSPSPIIYFSEILFAAFAQLVHLGNIVFIVRSIPESFRADWHKKFRPYHGALWILMVASVLNLLSYQNHPHITDEVVYLIQARFYAEGHMKMPAPPVPEGFHVYLMRVDGNEWYPVPPPGWPAVLALGSWFGAPWLINPLLAAINLLLAYSILKQLYDARIAHLTILLLCVSPWYIFLAMSFMTHMMTLFCLLFAAWAVLRSRTTGKSLWAFIAGLAVGYSSLIRPVDGLIVGALIALWAIGIGGQRLKWTALFALAAGTLLMGAAIFPWNAYYTGDPFVYPINLYTDEYFGKNSNAYGFGADRGMGWPLDPFPGHSPRDAVLNAALNTFSLNIELFGWSTGSLLLAAAFFFRKKFTNQDRLMLAVLITCFVAYFFYYYSGGPDFGARYWFLMIVPLAVLTIRGMDQVRGANLAVLVLSLFALINYVPWRAVDKYHHYWNMRPDVRELTKKYSFRKGLVFIRGESHPDYSSAAIYNPLDLHSDAPIYVWEKNDQVREKLLQHYTGRTEWIVNGPTVTKNGYKVARASRRRQP
ncbi:glycosyltransferase family 39 protein [bacterium]|nr:glycosyltransferase family 39 protein [bacterium]